MEIPSAKLQSKLGTPLSSVAYIKEHRVLITTLASERTLRSWNVKNGKISKSYSSFPWPNAKEYPSNLAIVRVKGSCVLMVSAFTKITLEEARERNVSRGHRSLKLWKVDWQTGKPLKEIDVPALRQARHQLMAIGSYENILVVILDGFLNVHIFVDLVLHSTVDISNNGAIIVRPNILTLTQEKLYIGDAIFHEVYGFSWMPKSLTFDDEPCLKLPGYEGIFALTPNEDILAVPKMRPGEIDFKERWFEVFNRHGENRGKLWLKFGVAECTTGHALVIQDSGKTMLIMGYEVWELN